MKSKYKINQIVKVNREVKPVLRLPQEENEVFFMRLKNTSMIFIFLNDVLQMVLKFHVVLTRHQQSLVHLNDRAQVKLRSRHPQA